MSTREHAHFDFDRTDFGRLTAVETHVFVQNHFAHCSAFEVAKDGLCVSNEGCILSIVLTDDSEDTFVFEHTGTEVCHSRIEVRLDHVGVDVLVQFVPDNFLDCSDELVMFFTDKLRLEFHLRLGAAFNELLLGLAHFLNHFVTGEDSANHRVFGHFVSTTFDHAHGVFRTGDHEV